MRVGGLVEITARDALYGVHFLRRWRCVFQAGIVLVRVGDGIVLVRVGDGIVLVRVGDV